MPIINTKQEILDQYNGVQTRIIKISCNDSLATVMGASYLNPLISSGQITILPNDMVHVTYSGGQAIFQPSIATNGTVTLVSPYPIVPSSYTIGNMVSWGSGNVLADSGIAANKVLNVSFANPDRSINLVAFDVICSYLSLNAGTINLYVPPVSNTAQYIIRQLYLNGGGGVNFAGGDKNISISDGVTTFSIIPAANLQALTNSTWGSTALPAPVGKAFNQPTASGNSLTAFYSGGTTNYSSGSVVISGILQRAN